MNKSNQSCHDNPYIIKLQIKTLVVEKPYMQFYRLDKKVADQIYLDTCRKSRTQAMECLGEKTYVLMDLGVKQKIRDMLEVKR